MRKHFIFDSESALHFAILSLTFFFIRVMPSKENRIKLDEPFTKTKISVSTMAFIVPVMKKDYILYSSAMADARKKRANSNPLEVRRKGEATRKCKNVFLDPLHI